jgi:hypothetical protein
MLLLILFFLSGAAALIYEVVWIRLLTLTLSITVYSLTTVLCAFMAGLAIVIPTPDKSGAIATACI